MSASKKKSRPAVKDKALIEKALQNLEGKLAGEEMKGTIGDMLRLLEYRKQLQDEQPKDVKVTWVDDKSSD